MAKLLKQHFEIQAVDVEFAHITTRCDTQTLRSCVLIQMRDKLEFDFKFGAKLHMPVSKQVTKNFSQRAVIVWSRHTIREITC